MKSEKLGWNAVKKIRKFDQIICKISVKLIEFAAQTNNGQSFRLNQSSNVILLGLIGS